MKSKLLVLVISTFALANWQCGGLSKLGLIPNEFEMAGGLKGALEQGLFKSFDAFANPKSNASILLKLPAEMDKVQTVLNSLGVKTSIPQITDKLTAAMGAAMTTAKPIFIQSLRNMSIKDAARILVTNNPHAATDYFKASATDSLTKALLPIVDSTVKLNGADTEYRQIANIYNNIPFLNKKIETNLSGFIAGRAIDAMFLIIAKEEQDIRSKYNFRKTDMIRKAFNYAEQEVKRKFGTQTLPN